jgi:rhomboid family protein
MLTSIWEDLKRQFNYGNMITRIILVNVAFFVLANIVKLAITVFGGFEQNGVFDDVFVKYFAIHQDLFFDLTHPWVVFTHMFFHIGFMHILFNMLFLYWFGRIVGDFIGNHRILPIYLMGGLFGALFYLLSANFVPVGSMALGASAAVMAFVVAAGVLSPNYAINLILIGEVKLKYVVAVLVFLDLVGIANLGNTGGHFAHLGGAAFGWLYVSQLRNGNDWAGPVNRWLGILSNYFSNIFKRKSKGPRMVYKNTENRKAKGSSASDRERPSQHQDRLDAILEKIKLKGYESLSEEEKDFLFNASKK